MVEIGKSDCDYCKDREKKEVFLKEKVSQRREIALISKFVRIKRNDFGVLEKIIHTPKYCFIAGKNSLHEREFQIVIGNNNTLNIPYGAIREIWEDVSGVINLELRLSVVFDEGATRDDKKLRLMQSSVSITQNRSSQ
ncbi:MAG: hypothetical protein LBU89_11190 [Fibromonadaceae bacterium]|jgi:hypothetical protein|nr:hypothetical protein [Fibromonadaceae bacterium]